MTPIHHGFRFNALVWPALATLAGALLAQEAGGAELRTLSRAQLLDKIRGGWAGQMIGVSYGAPTEFRSNAKINEAELTWSPERVSNSIGQDDLYVEMTFAKVMDDIGLGATCEQYNDTRIFSPLLYQLSYLARSEILRGMAKRARY